MSVKHLPICSCEKLQKNLLPSLCDWDFEFPAERILIMIDDYDKKQEDENRDNIAIDFDGVIHANSKGFFDGSIYDKLVPGAFEAIKELSRKYNVIIFTCKAKKDRPLIDDKGGVELVREWLKKHGLLEYIVDITSEKPRALLYIDDKAVEFKNWINCLETIKGRM